MSYIFGAFIALVILFMVRSIYLSLFVRYYIEKQGVFYIVVDRDSYNKVYQSTLKEDCKLFIQKQNKLENGK